MKLSRLFVALVVSSVSLAACGEEPKPASGGAPTTKPAGTGAPKTTGAASGAAAASGAGAASGATAASGAAAEAKSYACVSVKEESLCKEFGPKNVEAAGVDMLKGLCTGKGEWKEGSCPADKKVGSCATPEGTKVFYNDGPIPFDAAKGEKACKEGVPAGEWKAGS